MAVISLTALSADCRAARPSSLRAPAEPFRKRRSMSSDASGDRMSWMTMCTMSSRRCSRARRRVIAVGQFCLGPPERDMRLHPRQDFFDLKGLGHVVDAAGFERPDLVGRVGQRRDEDHRHVLRALARPETPADLVAIHLRQADVQQDEIGRVALHGFERLPSVGDGAHVVALLAQQVRQEPQRVDRVVDDQHAGRVGFLIHPMVVAGHRAFSILRGRLPS